MGIRGEIFSTRVQLPNRTYFFNVKENRLGDLYLNMVESKNKETSGFDRQSLVLFADDLSEFLKGFDEALKVLDKAQREKKKNPRHDRGGAPVEQRDERDHEAPVKRYGREDTRESTKRGTYPAGRSERRWEDTLPDNSGERDRRYNGDAGRDLWNRKETNRPPNRDSRDNRDKDSSAGRHDKKRLVVKRRYKKNED
jgi:hypothetical protein